MSVRNFLRRQVDANSSSSRNNCDKTEVESRPLSEYDNLTTFDRSNFPLVDIQFRFDDLSMSSVRSMMNNSNSSNSSSAVHNNNNESLNQTITTSSSQPATAHHKYENVLDTLQQRIAQQNIQQVNDDNSPRSSSSSYTQRPVMSDAKSSFFGLSAAQQKSKADAELDKLIEDIGSAQIVSNDRNQYVNFPPEDKTQNSSDKTSSVSGSSSTTATPSATPTRQDKIDSRKNSESGSSHRSKSPKFMLPGSTGAVSSPSQAIYMSTTVPQNLKGQNIIGRHKPTRQSLRHSRMIVTTTNKSFQGSRHHNSLNIKYVWLAKFVLTLKILIGISILVLGAWICLFANSTPIQQNPFWAGLILIISGLLGLYLLTFRRIRSKLKAKFFWFLKANAAVIIVLSVFSTTLALIYASFHYISLSSNDKHCVPENVFINGSSCICIFNYVPKNSTRNNIDDVIETHTDSSGLIHPPENNRNIVHFKDLSCSELATWSHILLTSVILNFIGLILAVCFMTQFIFGCKRRRKHYPKLRDSA